jgi:uncharacterized protein (TIGR01244 family)
MRRLAFLGLLTFTALTFPARSAGIAAPGIPNFHKVDDRIYRGAQPNPQAWESLAQLGVKTVIDLRPSSEHSCKDEKQLVEAAGMQYVNVPLKGLVAPSNKSISKVLSLVDDSDGPVFVHCRRGADRTGTVVACYRITHDGWTNQKALREAASYGMSWLEFGMHRYVLGFHPPQTASAAQ